MNKGRELLEAVTERGEIGFFDSAVQPAEHAVAAADENLSAARLAHGEFIFAAADGLIAFGKFRFAENFPNAPRRRAAAQTSIGGSHTESNLTSSNPANLNQQNLTAAGERESRAGERIVASLGAKDIIFGADTAETGGVRVRKFRRGETRGLMNRKRKREVHLEISLAAARAATTGSSDRLIRKGGYIINQKQK